MNVHSLLPCKKCGKFPILTGRINPINETVYIIYCRCHSEEDSILYTVIGNWNNKQEKERDKEK